MAERVGFEPTKGYKPLLVFKTSAFNRSATSPTMNPNCEHRVGLTQIAFGRFSPLRGALRASKTLTRFFEPTKGYKPLLVFKTSAFNRSATSPTVNPNCEHRVGLTQIAFGRFSPLRGALRASKTLTRIFEPTKGYKPLLVFKNSAYRSATSPIVNPDSVLGARRHFACPVRGLQPRYRCACIEFSMTRRHLFSSTTIVSYWVGALLDFH